LRPLQGGRSFLEKPGETSPGCACRHPPGGLTRHSRLRGYRMEYIPFVCGPLVTASCNEAKVRCRRVRIAHRRDGVGASATGKSDVAAPRWGLPSVRGAYPLTEGFPRSRPPVGNTWPVQPARQSDRNRVLSGLQVPIRLVPTRRSSDRRHVSESAPPAPVADTSPSSLSPNRLPPAHAAAGRASLE
jgi:hypothetical protein